MAQFDVYKNPNPKTRKLTPLLLDVQSDLLDPLATRVVIPLLRANVVRKPITRLNPDFEVNNMNVVLSTAELAGIPGSALGDPVFSLKDHRNDIINALDVLFAGV